MSDQVPRSARGGHRPAGRAGAASRWQRTWAAPSRGYSLIDLLLVAGALATAAAMSLPVLSAGFDEMRTRAAASHVAARLWVARFEAVRRSRAVGLRFEEVAAGARYTFYVDGNGNGIRNADIDAGIDAAWGNPERLEEACAGAAFGIARDLPGIEGGAALTEGDEPIRIGTSRILTFTPAGTATSGTLYIRGVRGTQYAVRVLGATGRTRILGYSPGDGRWTER